MIGRTLSHYEIVGEIGAGGMGVVYRARDTLLERDVALKILPADAVADDRAGSALPARGARRVGAQPSRTSSRSTTSCTTTARTLIVMELVEGTSLQQRLLAGAIPAAAGALAIARQIADALGGGARGGHHPPRPQAGQRDASTERRSGEGPRLRPRQARRERAHRPTPARTRRSPTMPGAVIGHGRLHVARAGARRARSTRAPTCSRSASCSTRCSAASPLSPRRRSPRSCTS